VTSLYGPIALAAAVIVVIDGAFVPTAPPAILHDGRVAAPVDLIARIADRIEVNADGTLSATRGERACVARALPDTDPQLVDVAPLARCLGATHVGFDRRTKTLALTFAPSRAVRRPAPFDASAPQAPPTTIFTPEPAPPTPRAIDTGSPRPRRTAIPVFAPPPSLTTPRPTSP